MLEQIDNIKLFIIIIAFHGFFLSALLAVGQVIVDRKSLKNLLFFVLFIDFSLLQVHSLLYEAMMLKKYVWLGQLNIPALYLMGPLLYLLSNFILVKGFKFKPAYLIHFIPVFLAVAAVSYAVIRFPIGNQGILGGYFYNSITMYIGYGSSLSLLGYIVLIWRLIHVNHVWSRSILKKEPSAVVITIFLFLFSIGRIADLMAMVTNKILFLELSILVITFTIIFFFLINFRYPGFYQTLQEAVEKERQKRSYLKGLNLKRVDSELRTLMTTEELFLQSDLSLSLLAEKLRMTPHQLSEFLNHHLDMNFTTFVNRYRIEKAKTLLLENKKRTVLWTAYEVGFESKSAFNAAFLKITGMSPTQFRKGGI
jgi:AraC-like DNA-binding protein